MSIAIDDLPLDFNPSFMLANEQLQVEEQPVEQIVEQPDDDDIEEISACFLCPLTSMSTPW
ncbi:hypothetical protein N7465_002728 [Penicillium sp. CMV-2018d]|nr:hypothetical protein N7465_002728 [Penicillium sp. CMV-2018d]